MKRPSAIAGVHPRIQTTHFRPQLAILLIFRTRESIPSLAHQGSENTLGSCSLSIPSVPLARQNASCELTPFAKTAQPAC